MCEISVLNVKEIRRNQTEQQQTVCNISKMLTFVAAADFSFQLQTTSFLTPPNILSLRSRRQHTKTAVPSCFGQHNFRLLRAALLSNCVRSLSLSLLSCRLHLALYVRMCVFVCVCECITLACNSSSSNTSASFGLRLGQVCLCASVCVCGCASLCSRPAVCWLPASSSSS